MDVQRSATARYSCRRSVLELVVTITAPFARTHLNMTCAGVPPIRLEIVARTGSSDPFGNCVMGLETNMKELDEKQMTRVDGSTDARLPYASVTMPCLAEYSRTSLYDEKLYGWKRI